MSADEASAAADAAGLRQGWLAYARRVVSDEAHLAVCAALGGSRPGAGYEPDLRWPGVLGADYEPGGVLWVSNVHRNFDSGLMPAAEMDRLVAATRAWKEARLGDGDYLLAVQRAYAVRLRSWDVGRPLRQFVALSGMRVEQLVYANAARCQTHDAGVRLQEACLAWLPLRVLVEAVRPRLLVCTSATAIRLLPELPGEPVVVGVHQWYGTVMPLSSPWQLPGAAKAGPSVWVPAALAAAGFGPAS